MVETTATYDQEGLEGIIAEWLRMKGYEVDRETIKWELDPNYTGRDMIQFTAKCEPLGRGR